MDRNQYQEPDLFYQMIWKMVLFQRYATQYVIPLLISRYGGLIILGFVIFQAFVITSQRKEHENLSIYLNVAHSNNPFVVFYIQPILKRGVPKITLD